MSTPTTTRQFPLSPRSQITGILMLLALAIGIGGYWGPWITHRDVALILIGQDMGEFVKFLPEARNHTVFMERILFYLPPFCACCVFALLAASRTLRYHWILRALLLLVILPVSLALLPPVFSMPVLKSEEFRLQVIGVIFCWTLIPGWLLLRLLPSAVQIALIAILGLLGAIPALWQFLVILPAIQNVYGAPVHIGWGLIATVVGFIILLPIAVLVTLRQNSRS